jgi:uncharacterized membrane protein
MMQNQWVLKKFFSGIQTIPGTVLGAIVATVAIQPKMVGVSSQVVLALIVLAGSILGFLVGGLLGVLLGRRKPNSGIVPAAALHQRKRLIGENFAAELLTENICIERETSGLRIRVSRRNVEEAVISSAGKTALADMHVGMYAPVLRAADSNILDYMLDPTKPCPSPINLRKLTTDGIRIRWASGGIFSIVEFKGRKWIPLFFRDIRPYGWNMSLGSSERNFDTRQLATNNLDDELNNPVSIIGREFLEETLVLEKAFEDNVYSYNQKTFRISGAAMDANEQQAMQLNAKHVACRRNTDNIAITHSSKIIKAQPVNSSMKLVVEDAQGRAHTSDNVLVCINLLELGIEVVKVMEYELADNDYLLDGEILEIHRGNGIIETELTRMPVALVSYDFLNQKFGPAGASGLRYTLGSQPSAIIDGNIPVDDIHLFDWDVKRRIEIMLGSDKKQADERRRYLDWYDKFGSCFVDDKGNPTMGRAPGLFTPTTVKILKLFFNNEAV